MSELFQDLQQHRISNIVVLDSPVLFSLSTIFSVGLLLYMDNTLNIIVVDEESDMDNYLNDETCVCIGFGEGEYQYNYNRECNIVRSSDKSSVYTSFGLLFHELAEDLIGDYFYYRHLDSIVCKPIDNYIWTANDDTCDVISQMFYPHWRNSLINYDEMQNSMSERLFIAGTITKDIIKVILEHYKGMIDNKNYVLETYQNSTDKRFCICDRYSYGFILAYEDADECIFHICPNGKEWKVTVLEDLDTGMSKVKIPETLDRWNLFNAKVSRNYIYTDTKENAMNICKYILEHQ